MRVDLRCGDVGVTKHLLNDAQISPPSEQVGGEAMPEKVRVDVGVKSGTRGVSLDQLPHPLRGQLSSADGEKDLRSRAPRNESWPFEFQVSAQCPARFRPDRNQAGLVSFAGHADHPFL